MNVYIHEQNSLNTTWTVNHNFGTNDIICDVILSDGPSSPNLDKILPLTVIQTSDTVLTITFSSGHTGVVRVLGL